MGVRGFRVDASKHMWPGDLEAIQGMTQVHDDDDYDGADDDGDDDDDEKTNNFC